MLGVGTTTLVSHAAGQRNKERALLVFNQSQVLSSLVGGIFLVVAMAMRTTYAERLSADPATAAAAADYLLYFLPAMGLQFLLVAMSSALRGIGNFKPGHGRADRDGRHQHRARADPDLRLGHRRGDGRRRRRDRHAGRRRGWRAVARHLLRRQRSATCGS